MRISEFCELMVNDIDLEGKTVNIDHQLQRNSDMTYHIETTKTKAGIRKLPITDEVADAFARILEERGKPKPNERVVGGYRGFLFIDDVGMNPKPLQYLMGHSDIGVTLNTYTHLGLQDATEELTRILEARKELDKQEVKNTVPRIREFKAV